jgi:hypothetical protein
MRPIRVATVTSLTIACGVLCAQSALAQMRTEVRDPLRGVSFHSVGLGDDAVNSLQVVEGTFADSDRLTLGLSVLVFDASHVTDEYILWIRHEGRRWLDFNTADQVVVEVNGERLPLEPLRASQPFVGESARFFEKIELKLTANDVAQLIRGNTVKVQLRSNNGVVDKWLTREEIAELKSFVSSLAGGES